MTTRRDLRMRENELQRLLAGQFTIQQRLTVMRDELGLLMRNLDRLALPTKQRRRRTLGSNVVELRGHKP